MRHCRERLPESTRTVYVGDGEWDVVASAALGWDFVGVGRGLEGRCAVWFPDLRSSPRLSEVLGLEPAAAPRAPS